MKNISCDLQNLEVLILDIQATSANPQKGDILEIGWLQTEASRDFLPEKQQSTAEVFTAAVPAPEAVPTRIRRITGISPEELKQGEKPEIIWRRLLQKAAATAKKSYPPLEACPTVIHFARYETPFLQAWHQKYSPDKAFPFDIICTHRIASRIFPGLPRKGIRAVSGYLGWSLPLSRRAAYHVTATAYIWRRLAAVLRDQFGITTLVHLKEWLLGGDSITPRGNQAREYPMNRDLRLNLPDHPGVYRFFRRNGDLLYIGKAKSLKRRINSYFQKRVRHAEHILEMLSQAVKMEITETETALEAALLESDEIKKFTPPYNRALRIEEREPVFFSADLGSQQARPDRKHIIGPIPSSRLILPLAKLKSAEGRFTGLSAEDIEQILGIPPGSAPDQECFSASIEYLKREYCPFLSARFDLRTMKKMGTFFWKEKMEREKKEKPDLEEIPDLEENEQEIKKQLEIVKERREWTPEEVARALRSIIRTGIHALRRSIWLLHLSEAVLCWQAANQSGKTATLIIEQGKPRFLSNPRPLPGTAASAGNPSEDGIPLPPGYAIPLPQRRAHLDIFTYDRLRILNTEIRRLLAEDRPVLLSLGPKLKIDNIGLSRILKWI